VILVDTSIWIDHVRRGDELLASLLEKGEVLVHPFVIGELALGSMARRDIILNSLRRLPKTSVARDEEVIRFVDREALFGIGIGYVDAHLLAATRLTIGATLWSRDRRLLAAAEKLSLASRLLH
jgi:predicted nucleic acid-binding protein